MFIHTPSETFDPEKHFTGVPLYQGMFFGQWQRAYGRKVVTLAINDGEGKVRMFIQCIEYVFPPIGSVWYAARGPIGSCSSVSIEEGFYRELEKRCVDLSPGTAHIRVQLEPQSQYIRTVSAERSDSSFMQPLSEMIVSLDEDMEAVVSRFSKSTKRIVRQYEQEKGTIRFSVERIDFMSRLPEVYDLLKETAAVKGFALHPFSYYEALFSSLNMNPEYGTLVTGYTGDGKKPVSAVLILFTGEEACHLFAGSAVTGYEKHMPTLTLYTAMKEAKKQGARRYNLGGVSSGVPGKLDNLSVFKGKFGGSAVIYEHPRDYVVSFWRYRLFRFLRLYPILWVRRFVVKWYGMMMRELSRED